LISLDIRNLHKAPVNLIIPSNDLGVINNSDDDEFLLDLLKMALFSNYFSIIRSAILFGINGTYSLHLIIYALIKSGFRVLILVFPRPIA